jgi:hypothetical protein
LAMVLCGVVFHRRAAGDRCASYANRLVMVHGKRRPLVGRVARSPDRATTGDFPGGRYVVASRTHSPYYGYRVRGSCLGFVRWSRNGSPVRCFQIRIEQRHVGRLTLLLLASAGSRVLEDSKCPPFDLSGC